MFITFEGVEGSGKTTVLESIAQALEASGHMVLRTREPGDGPWGARIRDVLLHGGPADPWAEVFLFLADRAQHVCHIVGPGLERGMIVLCDRYTDSTVAYQGHARGLPVDTLRMLNGLATYGLKPNLTLLFDVDPLRALGRVISRNRLDDEPMAFHEAVRQGFLTEVALEPDRWVVLDASRQASEVAIDALAEVEKRLKCRV